MVTRHGHTINSVTEEQWYEARGLVKMILITTASRGRLITYGALCDQVAATLGVQLDPHLDMGFLVGELSETEHIAGRFMISAIVVKEDPQDRTPGKGFFDCAKMLGLVFNDEATLWGQQVKLVHNVWKTHKLRTL